MYLQMTLAKPTDTALTYNVTYDNLARPQQGPLNPFKSHDGNGLKRKNVLTGYAEETSISDASFNAQHRTFQSSRFARDPTTGEIVGDLESAKLVGGKDLVSRGISTAETREIRAKRQKKGDPSIVEGDGSYVGPWARYKDEARALEDEAAMAEEELASDEEYEEEAVAPAPLVPLYAKSNLDSATSESTEFHGTSEHDYQGRTYIHIPQDLDVDLRKELGSEKNFVPKKLIHTWSGHTKAVTALRFFPSSGHVLLSAGADSKMKLWDVYHSRELLRSFSGHTKSITDVQFTPSGTNFLSASYDRQIKLWDTETGIVSYRVSTGKIPHCIAINPSSPHEFLSGQSDKKIVQFDTRKPYSEGPVQEYDHHLGAINTLTFCDADRRFISTSDDKSLRAWEFGIPTPIKLVAEPYMYALTSACAHPSGKYVAFQSGDNQIVVYACTDKFRQNRKKAFRGHNNAGYAIDVSISPDGNVLAGGDSGGYVCFWDWKTCKMWHKIKAGEGAVTVVQWAPQESSKVATAGLEGKIKFWD
jgi:pre-mRNA-processing factor 17